jgi:hypothetical protein
MKVPRMSWKTGRKAPSFQGPKVFVVIDSKGAGRVLGVFDHQAHALEILAVRPSYCRVFPMHLNEIDSECLRWVQDERGLEMLPDPSAQMTAMQGGKDSG